MANVCVVTTDVAEGQHVAQALSLVGKRGRVVITAIGHRDAKRRSRCRVLDLTLYEKQVRGSLFGSSNPRERYLRTAVAVRQRPAQARRTDHPRVHARRGEPGLRRHAQRAEPAGADPLLILFCALFAQEQQRQHQSGHRRHQPHRQRCSDPRSESTDGDSVARARPARVLAHRPSQPSRRPARRRTAPAPPRRRR